MNEEMNANKQVDAKLLAKKNAMSSLGSILDFSTATLSRKPYSIKRMK